MKAVLATCLLLFASLAQAQYVWVDEKGIKQFSDRPPPPNTPKKNILKEPGQVSPYQMQDASAPAEPPKDAPKTPTLADRNADFKKRQKESAEADKKAAEEAQRARDEAANCRAAREALAGLESGARIGLTAPNGERSFMSDEQRAQELAKTRRILANCKN
ncbi:DUF4124 domain-containing protein [Massilia sp. TS11]|uniref:DUF4124 domain-containing protein n=1 Tax=Massilia sp. TS11 TaxID=2908003 RepID=UPI001EDB940D|nr:DUF4124 domain-containing protein [Massilia sp. TS11]MCG2584114.1 DUF4124 domain-containing protein [Massilia sp. TS11]